jgi:hypothetical protein
MSGISDGNIYGGIGKGIERATDNILKLYGLQQDRELRQQGMAIDQLHADNARKRLHLDIASRAEGDFDPHHWHQQNLDAANSDGKLGRVPGSGANLRMPGATYTPDPALLSGAGLLKRS